MEWENKKFSAFIAWLSEQNIDEDIIIDTQAFNTTSQDFICFNILSRIAAIFDESKAIKVKKMLVLLLHIIMMEVEMVSLLMMLIKTNMKNPFLLMMKI